MPLILVLPFLLLIVILAALSVARVSELRERRRTHHLASVGSIVFASFRPRRTFTIIRIADAFEPEASILWETQVSALDLICAAGRRGLPTETLRPLYTRSVVLYPELYEGTEFEAWLQFLEDAKLISCGENTVAITPAGIEFLKCRVAARAAV